ncbi:MAG TPA: beta-agarase [Verrucomicrobiae bacterium]|nr:beta-agarase [Verrucomicrobiae bacterium]
MDNPGADGTKNCVTDSLALGPDQSGVLKVALKRTSDGKLGGKLFGMRGYPVTPGGPGTVDPKNITQILLFVNKPSASHTFELQDLRATGPYTPPTASVADAEPFFPFIDTFGQYKHRDWPGKVHSLTELAERRAEEAKELAAQPGPSEWDQYGGWNGGPQLAASGYFRAEKYRGKWWLIDPEGHLFWSHGIDCVRALDPTPIDERAEWFENFPGDQVALREFLSGGYALKGHYAGRSPKTFSFSGANLWRKYGADWRQEYNEVIHRRLRSWGLNTIGNWSDETTRLMRRTPYTDTLSSRGAKNIEGSDGYWGKFPDVFDPSFESGVRRSMGGRKGRTAGDPWCLGYFSDNEMSWGEDTSLALAALKSPAEQAAKKALVVDLKAKYDDIAKLNTVWGTKHESWEALLESREAPDKKKAHADLVEFYSKAAEHYFRTVRDAIQAAAPNQLYLGCRFAWVNERAAIAAGKYCDVVSYNLYKRTIADFKYPGADKPLIVGEFHFGALDRGMFHTGLVPVANQSERAQTYQDYVLGAARHPQFVGTHWFQWKDEPTTGRVYDEENYQIGFVDVADTPYREIIEASRAVGRRLYRERIADSENPKPK